MESRHDQLLAEVDDRSEDQGIGIVDPDNLTDDNQLVHSTESWDVESHHVWHIVLMTVDGPSWRLESLALILVSGTRRLRSRTR